MGIIKNNISWGGSDDRPAFVVDDDGTERDFDVDRKMAMTDVDDWEYPILVTVTSPNDSLWPAVIFVLSNWAIHWIDYKI